MIGVYIISSIMFIVLTINSIKSIKQKKYVELIISVMIFIFIIYITSNFILGGSAATDAAQNYELYEEGCYYLVSHNKYTKVTYEIYQYMKIMGIISKIAFVIAFGLSIYNTYVNKKQKHNQEE